MKPGDSAFEHAPTTRESNNTDFTDPIIILL